MNYVVGVVGEWWWWWCYGDMLACVKRGDFPLAFWCVLNTIFIPRLACKAHYIRILYIDYTLYLLCDTSASNAIFLVMVALL